MNVKNIRVILLCCLGMLAGSAQALITCAGPGPLATPATQPPANGDASRVAQLLAGLEPRGEPVGPAFAQYAAAANEGWQTYLRDFGQPLHTWANREVRQDVGGTVFYPFSGPDLPSVLAVYPGASRYVMISDQYALQYFDPFALNEYEQGKVIRDLADSWARFGRLGFFLTRELNKGSGRKLKLGPSMILMAFAVRLGYDVRAIRPICLDPVDLSIRPADAKDARWGSVRLELRKNGRDIVVDYLQQDLSDHGLGKGPEVRALIESLARGPILLKAASHLPQRPRFAILRNAILAHAPMVVQDETGLEYEAMAAQFNVRLYGEYVGAHRLFKESINPTLIQAYRERAREVRPLSFKLGYEKEAGSAIQVATRK